MALRFASWEENGKTVHGLIEKPCDSSCLCQKGREKGVSNLAIISLSDLSEKCDLQRIPGLVDEMLRPQITRNWDLFTHSEFETHCKEERKSHLDAADKSIRFLANPFNTIYRSELISKLWNEQAARVYTEYLAANAINGNAMVSPNATGREPQLKTLSDALQNGFTIERLTCLIADVEPNWKTLNEANKDKKQTSLAGSWKRVFPLAALALMERGYITQNISYRALSQLFSKHFDLSDLVKTFQNWMKPDQVSEPNYLKKANDWLDEHA